MNLCLLIKTAIINHVWSYFTFLCVISCVKYVDSRASCLWLCFPTPAVQISITNISPRVTLSFLSVKRPWLASIYVQIGPKILDLELWMNVDFNCMCEARTHQCAWMCKDSGLCSLIIQQLPFSLTLFLLSCLSAALRMRPSVLKSDPVESQTVCLCSFLPLSASSLCLHSDKENKVFTLPFKYFQLFWTF